MGDDDKPFLCSAVGCGQKFTNEDHLAVHMRKHEMSLALNLGTGGSTLKTPVGSGTGLFLDQTPTPTKFLKNCEEIGLFQELNKNPFEEAFKKAMDSSDVEILPGPGSNELNTPIPPIPKSISDLTQPLVSKTDFHTNDDIVNLVLSHKRKVTKVESPQPTSTTSEDEIEVVGTSKSDDAASPPTLGSNSWANSSMLPINSLELPVVTAAQSTTLTKTSVATTPNTTNPIIHQPQPSAVTMQVYLQLPNGQTVPVQIPTATVSPVQISTATVSPALHVVQSGGVFQKLPGVITVPQQSQPQSQAQTQLHSEQPQVATAVAQPLLVQSTVSSQTQTAITKQKLKAAIQQQTLPSPNKPTTQIIQVSPDTSHQIRPAPQIIQVSPDTNHQRPATQIIQVSPDTNHQRPATQIIQVSPDQNSHINNFTSNSNLIGSSSAVAAISSPLSVETGSIASDGMSSPDRAESPFSHKKFKRNSDGSEPTDDRRKKFLERNRAAAARCRQKRKNWINSLEKKADDMSSTNGRLQSEVNMLKAEVAQLKTLLLAHKDCPITLQQKSQGQFPTISVIEPVQIPEATVTNYHTTSNDIDIVSTGTNPASWVQTQVITAVPSVQTQAVTMTTGNKITIIPRVIKTETTKPTRRK